MIAVPGQASADRPMRVAIMTRALPSYRFPLYLELLRRRAFDFRIFCEDVDVNDPSRKAPAPPPELPITLANHTPLRRYFWRKAGLPLPAFSLAREMKRYQPDAVILEGLGNLGTDLACLPYLLRKRVPFAWWTLGDIPATAHLLRARLGRPVQRWFTKRAGAVLAYSSYAVRVIEAMGVDPQKIVNVRNTLDVQAVLRDIERCRPQVESLRQQLQSGNAPVAVFCGTLHAGKRIDLLLDAWARLPDQSPAPVLLIIGDGPAYPAAIEQARQLGIEDRVRFVGRQSENVSAYMLLGDFFVLPGLGGLAINHAFAHRMPVICGRADGCEEDLIPNGETGIRLEAVTPESLAEAIQSLLADPERTRQMGENAYIKITEEITLAHFAERIIQGVEIATGISLLGNLSEAPRE